MGIDRWMLEKQVEDGRYTDQQMIDRMNTHKDEQKIDDREGEKGSV